MKFIVSVIKPHMLEPVRTALAKLGIEGLTVSEVMGHGRQKGHTEIYRGAEYEVTLVPKVKLEVAVEDTLADQTVDVLSTAARSGHIGDGKIFVLPLDAAVRIRTGEGGPRAL